MKSSIPASVSVALALLLSASAGAVEIAAHPTAPGIEPPRSYRIWIEGLSLQDGFRAGFMVNKEPKREHVESLIKKPPGTDVEKKLMAGIYSRQSGTIRTSRRGLAERFEVDQDSSSLNFASAGEADRFQAPRKDFHYAEAHGDGVFHYHSKSFNNGAIRREWHERTMTPFSYLAPPAAHEAELVSVSEDGRILDFRTKENDLQRYHLDPENGMMPVKVEYFDILPDKSLFLFRFFTVEKYEATGNGVYIPRSSTLHDFATRAPDGTLNVGTRTEYLMNHFEENVQFPPDEFQIKFPSGTRVTDYIANVTYTVDEPSVATVQGLGADPTAAAPAAQPPASDPAAAAVTPASHVAPTAAINQNIAGRTSTSLAWWMASSLAFGCIMLVLIGVYRSRDARARATPRITPQ